MATFMPISRKYSARVIPATIERVSSTWPFGGAPGVTARTSVDGRFASCHRHVGRVGDQACTLHNGHIFSFDLGGELGEVLQDFRHLVATLAAANVDNALGVGVLAERLRNDSFAAAEGTGNGASSAEDGRKQ